MFMTVEKGKGWGQKMYQKFRKFERHWSLVSGNFKFGWEGMIYIENISKLWKIINFRFLLSGKAFVLGFFPFPGNERKLRRLEKI